MLIVSCNIKAEWPDPILADPIQSYPILQQVVEKKKFLVPSSYTAIFNLEFHCWSLGQLFLAIMT